MERDMLRVVEYRLLPATPAPFITRQIEHEEKRRRAEQKEEEEKKIEEDESDDESENNDEHNTDEKGKSIFEMEQTPAKGRLSDRNNFIHKFSEEKNEECDAISRGKEERQQKKDVQGNTQMYFFAREALTRVSMELAEASLLIERFQGYHINLISTSIHN